MADDNEYMIMDADHWDNQDDTYENGDTLGLDIGRKENSGAQEERPDPKKRKKEKKKGKAEADANTAQPPDLPPDRYMTIRRPALGKNTGMSKKHKLVFFKSAAVWLVVLCTVLTGVLAALSVFYTNLAGVYIKETEKAGKLLEENNKLKMEKEMAEKQCRPVYRISSTENPERLHGNDLVILNYRVLEEHMRNGAFFLYGSSVNNGSCNYQSAWNCTC